MKGTATNSAVNWRMTPVCKAPIQGSFGDVPKTIVAKMSD